MRQTDEIVFCFDGDNAGRTAAWRAVMNALPVLTDGLKLSFLFLPQEHDPDSYVREFGKERFEAEIKVAMPLSQYILKYLSAENALQSQEDKVRFLNEAEPIMRQINAPRSAMYLRKKVAELAQLPIDEMQSLLKLPSLHKTPVQSKPKLTRTTLSLQKRFCLSLFMRPDLARQDDLIWATGNTDEDILLQQTIETCLDNIHSKPVVIMRELESRINEKLFSELKHELNMLDETLDFTLELTGARQQLQQRHVQKKENVLLAQITEKPLSALTENEKVLLKSLGNKHHQKKT
jgi:DNA primase